MFFSDLVINALAIAFPCSSSIWYQLYKKSVQINVLCFEYIVLIFILYQIPLIFPVITARYKIIIYVIIYHKSQKFGSGIKALKTAWYQTVTIQTRSSPQHSGWRKEANLNVEGTIWSELLRSDIMLFWGLLFLSQIFVCSLFTFHL